AIGAGDTVQCPFTITVTNTGPGDFTGPLDIIDQIDFDRANLGNFSPPFVCTPFGGGTGEVDCRLDNVTIPAGGTTTLTLSTNIAQADQASAPCQLLNQATLTAGAGPNIQAQAPVDITGVAPNCGGGGGGGGQGGQPNLVVEKEAGPCAIGAGD